MKKFSCPPSLVLECWDEPLSDAQLKMREKAADEHNEFQLKIAELCSMVDSSQSKATPSAAQQAMLTTTGQILLQPQINGSYVAVDPPNASANQYKILLHPINTGSQGGQINNTTVVRVPFTTTPTLSHSTTRPSIQPRPKVQSPRPTFQPTRTIVTPRPGPSPNQLAIRSFTPKAVMPALVQAKTPRMPERPVETTKKQSGQSETLPPRKRAPRRILNGNESSHIGGILPLNEVSRDEPRKIFPSLDVIARVHLSLKSISNKNLLDVNTYSNHKKKIKLKNIVAVSVGRNFSKNKNEINNVKKVPVSEVFLKSGFKLTTDDVSIIKSLLHEGSATDASVTNTSFLLKLLKMSKHANHKSLSESMDCQNKDVKTLIEAIKKQMETQTVLKESSLHEGEMSSKRKRYRVVDDGVEPTVDKENNFFKSDGSNVSNIGKSKRYCHKAIKSERHDEYLDSGTEEESKNEPVKNNSSSESIMKGRIRKGKRSPQKTTNYPVENKEESEGEDADNDDEDCALPNCRRPVGAQVDWVQCDQCESWYHLHCINLAKSDVKEDEEFICQECKKPSRFPRKCKKNLKHRILLK